MTQVGSGRNVANVYPSRYGFPYVLFSFYTPSEGFYRCKVRVYWVIPFKMQTDCVRTKKVTLTGFCHRPLIQITVCTLTKIRDEITRVSATGKVRSFSLALLADNSLGAHGWSGRLSIAILYAGRW